MPTRRSFNRLAVLAALATLPGVTARAAGQDKTPTAPQIEALLRESLDRESRVTGRMPAYGTATLVDFELLTLERIGPARWRAETDLEFDFGPPPAGVLGYERRRRGLYHLDIRQADGRFELLRFHAAGSLQRLPGRRNRRR